LPTSTPGPRRVDTAVIVGAVLGSLTFICLILLLLLFLVRRRQSLKSRDGAGILRKEVEATNALVQPNPSPPMVSISYLPQLSV
jgi:hypothetical protein